MTCRLFRKPADAAAVLVGRLWTFTYSDITDAGLARLGAPAIITAANDLRSTICRRLEPAFERWLGVEAGRPKTGRKRKAALDGPLGLDRERWVENAGGLYDVSFSCVVCCFQLLRDVSMDVTCLMCCLQVPETADVFKIREDFWKDIHQVILS